MSPASLEDVDAIHKALSDHHQDEERLVDIVLRQTTAQLPQLRKTYKERVGRDLTTDLEVIKDQLLRNAITYLVLGPLGMEAHCLHEALHDHHYKHHDGPARVAHIMCGRSNANLTALEMLYESWYGSRIVDDIRKADKEPRRALLFSKIHVTTRVEEGEPVDDDAIANDLDELIRTGRVEQPRTLRENVEFAARSGNLAASEIGLAPDEEAFYNLLISRSNAQICELDHLHKAKPRRGPLTNLVRWGYENPLSAPLQYFIWQAIDQTNVIYELIDTRGSSDLSFRRSIDNDELVYWLVWMHYHDPDLIQRVRYCWDVFPANVFRRRDFLSAIRKSTSDSLAKLLLGLVSRG